MKHRKHKKKKVKVSYQARSARFLTYYLSPNLLKDNKELTKRLKNGMPTDITIKV